jgi:hypothetical protein
MIHKKLVDPFFFHSRVNYRKELTCDIHE